MEHHTMRKVREILLTFDPDIHIQKSTRLIFDKFLELGSIRKVMFYFVRKDIKLPRRQPSGSMLAM